MLCYLYLKIFSCITAEVIATWISLWNVINVQKDFLVHTGSAVFCSLRDFGKCALVLVSVGSFVHSRPVVSRLDVGLTLNMCFHSGPVVFGLAAAAALSALSTSVTLSG